MQIEGVIENIIFRNAENGYTVAKLEAEGDSLTIVGRFIDINIGDNVSLEGDFVTNKKFGEQFSFTSYESIMPQTLEGIKRYLSSGLISGIGPVTANNIVKKFKEDTFTIMEMCPERLSEVKGISDKKAQKIGEQYNDKKKIQNAIMFLLKYNISTNMALKIYDTYGANTLERVKNNPYRLIEDVEGIGFLTADKIANNMGIKRDSEFRIRAGFFHILSNASDKNGHTYLPKVVLIEEVSTLLELDKDEYKDSFDSVIQNLILDKALMIFWAKGYEVAMLTKFYFTENAIAQKLALLNISSIDTEYNLEEDISHYEQLNKLTLHKDQKIAIETAVNSGVSVITGGPGTGKTTIIKCIISLLKDQQKEIILLAPTGRAAKRLSDSTGEEAKTIHRALEVSFNKNERFNYNESNPLPYDVIIVDEVSMVDAILMSSLLKALSRDAKLILVGDKDQLPSVGAGNVLDDIIKSDIIKTVMLTKIYRQSDTSLIVSNAHLINNGKMPEIDNSSSDFFFESKLDNNDIKDSIINMVTTRIPKFLNLSSSHIQVLAPLKAGVCGIDNLNKTLQEKLNPPAYDKQEIQVGNTIFRVGDKVMQTSNNYDLVWKKINSFLEEEGEGVFNGDIGYIDKIDFQTGETTIEFEDGRICIYPRRDISELSLAYAITIHKSQGSEFDVVIIPCISGPSIILNRNLIYTAVTRAKKMVVLVGDVKNLRRMISNKYTLQRFTMLKEFLIESDKKAREMFL